MNREEVFQILEGYSKMHNDRYWSNTQIRKSPCDYLVLVEHHLGRAKDKWIDAPDCDNILRHMLDATAALIACMEENGHPWLGISGYGQVIDGRYTLNKHLQNVSL